MPIGHVDQGPRGTPRAFLQSRPSGLILDRRSDGLLDFSDRSLGLIRVKTPVVTPDHASPHSDLERNNSLDVAKFSDSLMWACLAWSHSPKGFLFKQVCKAWA